jgi:hypothetical protein
MALLYAAWLGGDIKTRELILKDPALVVRAHEATRRARERPGTPGQQMLSDLGALAGLAGRIYQRTQRGGLRGLLPPEQEEIQHMFSQASREVARLLPRLEKELEDARRGYPTSGPATA